MKKSSLGKERKRERGRRPSRSISVALIKWGLLGAAAVSIVYGVSHMSGIAYTDKDIKVVDFSTLSPGKKTSALRAANAARCPCGCGMTLAQCVSTDSTCPIRETNIERIKTIVRDADQP
jgi:hypothetical protein